MGQRQTATLDTAAHPAFRAWCDLTPHTPLPTVIEYLQHKSRSQVYRLRWSGDGGSIIAKRCRTHMTVVERAAYRVALPSAQVRVPAYYGYLDDASASSDDPFAWLFIEDMGSRRFSPNDAGERLRLAQWLGSLQATLLQPEATNTDELPIRDADYYRPFLRRAIEDLPTLTAERSSPGSIPALIGTVQSALWCVQRHWDEVAATFASVPMTLVHGDCLPKNIHVAHDKNGCDVVPIDWGNAGWGLPASDLGQSALLLADAAVTNACYDEYAAALRPAWPTCSTSIVQRLANLGRLLWSIKVIAMSVPGFRYNGTAKVEQYLSIYSSVLLTSLRVANWTSAN